MIIAFVVLMILWIAFASVQSFPDLKQGDWSTASGCLLITLILLILGWRIFV